LKTDSLREMQPRIVAILVGLDVPKETPGIGGIEAPGGIQFDLVVPSSAVASLMAQLKKLPTSSRDAAADSVGTPTAFTWYKNKSKRKLANGKARVVIWLSQT
jgi:hypothetical protein